MGILPMKAEQRASRPGRKGPGRFRFVSRFADPDAIIVHEAGSVSLHGFGFNPIGGRELFFYYGAHLGSGVGTAAGVKLARELANRPNVLRAVLGELA